MNIQVGDNYLIKSDNMNYILYKKGMTDPNHRFSKGVAKEYWEVVGYYHRWSQLANALLERELKESEALLFQDLTAVMEKVEHTLVRKLEEVSHGKEQN